MTSFSSDVIWKILYFPAFSLFIFLLRCLSTKWNPEIFICHHVMTKPEGTKIFFYRIYNIHFKEPLAWNAGDGLQAADWASLRHHELRVADGVSNTAKPNFNGEGHCWWNHGHNFGTSRSLLLRGQGGVGMANWGLKGSEDLGAERWVSSMCHPGPSKISELCSCQLLQQQIWLIRPSAPSQIGLNSMVQLDQNSCKL